MQLPEICIKRPVFATVLSLIILLVGLISYTRLSVREYPRIDEPVVSVNTTYRGASAEVVESQVTKILEDSLSGIEGVEVMTSQSRSEQSRINVRFTLKRDPDGAAADVRDKVARVRAKMPDTIDEPVIAKVEADSQPVIYIAVEAGSLTPLDASDYVLHSAAPVGAARRVGCAHLRRAPGVDADQPRPHKARRLQADRPGRRGCAPPSECGDTGGTHRISGARVHRGC
jgi:multidrug efflux pump subunit AcrB